MFVRFSSCKQPIIALVATKTEEVSMTEWGKKIVIQKTVDFILKQTAISNDSKVFLFSDIIQTGSISDSTLKDSHDLQGILSIFGTYLYQKMAFQVPLNWEDYSKLIVCSYYILQ